MGRGRNRGASSAKSLTLFSVMMHRGGGAWVGYHDCEKGEKVVKSQILK